MPDRTTKHGSTFALARIAAEHLSTKRVPCSRNCDARNYI
jgi:hypothetical protein